MKILWLFSEDYPFGRGEETFIPPELPELAKHFSVTIISTNLVDPQTSALPDGIRAVRNDTRGIARKIMGRIRALFSPVFYREILRIMKSRKHIIKNILWAWSWFSIADHSVRSLSGLLRESKPDVVYCFWRRPYLLGALLHRKRLGNPLIIARAHRKDLYDESAHFGQQVFGMEVDRMIDKMFLISRSGCDYYLNTYSVSDPHKCRVAYLGTPEPERMQEYAYSDIMRVFSCCYLIPRKRVHLIIEALSLIKDRKVEWVHAGGGELEGELRALAAEKLADNVTYKLLGTVPNKDVRAQLVNFSYDCFLTASESEGLPVTAMEAASYGLPAVAPAIDGIPEVVTPESGILLPANPTPEEIADALIRIKDMPREEYMSMRAAARALWEDKFRASVNAKRFTEKIVKMMEER